VPLASTQVFKSCSSRQYKKFVTDSFAKDIELIQLQEFVIQSLQREEELFTEK